MPNVLTGDFDAVLQISGGTVNRLLASMHQNAFSDRSVPSVVHSASFPLHAKDVRGIAYAQIAAPRIELLDDRSDRFLLEFSVRVKWEGEPGSEYLPRYIHCKSIRAEYEFADVDPECEGWANAAEYVWIRVVPDTIEIDVDYDDDDRVTPSIPSGVEDQIEVLVKKLMRTQFAPAPQRVGSQFRPGSMLSLHKGGEAAVAIPVGLGGGAPKGDIHSVDSIFLAGSDFGIAIPEQHRDDRARTGAGGCARVAPDDLGVHRHGEVQPHPEL